MKDRFQQLISEFCDLAGADPQKMIKGDAFEMQGVTFAVEYRPKANERVVLVYADFGAVPANNEAYAYYQLLRENHLSFAVKGASFTVSSATGNVVYAEHFDLAKTTAESFGDALLEIAVQAKRWRAEFASSTVAVQPRRTAFLNIDAKQ
jgi:hypothetical protein